VERFEGRVAVVTGAGGGIGAGLAARFAREGMRVVLADVEEEALEDATARIVSAGGEAVAVPTDVSSAAAVRHLADRSMEVFGAVNILCNNAGVIRAGNAWDLSVDDWSWVLGVNLWGVVHGLREFVPRMLAQGDECHIVNTASAGGLAASRGGGAYGASKFAVVAISEGIAEALADTPIGVSVLCPGGVASGIFRSDRNRPAELGDVGPMAPDIEATFAALASSGRTDQVSPESIAEMVVDAIRAEQLYILPMQTHHKDRIRERMARIEQALAASPTTG
jgi:NAD(P)-dependent dehydrogenase (short-subunit alcohol dehydrogenase family)